MSTQLPSLLRAEVLKQRTTRMVPITLASSLGFALFLLTQIITNAGVRGAPSLGTTALARQVIGVPVLASLPLLVLGVISMTAEHRHGTAASTFLAVPHRHRIVTTKAMVSAGLAAVWAAVTIAAVNGAAIPWLSRLGVDHLALMTPQMWTSVGAILVVLPLFAAMGVGIGAIARNQVVGTIVPIVWLLLLEPNVIAPRFPVIQRFLPGVASNIAGSTPHAPEAVWWTGLIVLAAWAIGLLGIGSWLTHRRDL